MHIHDVMTQNPIIIPTETTAEKAAQLMAEKDIGSLIIGDSNNLAGFITDRDIALRVVAKGKPSQTPVQDIMTKGVITCQLHDEVEDVALNMQKNKILRMAVMDNNGKICGIVSHGDLARAAGFFGQDNLSENVTELAAQNSANQDKVA